MSGTLTLIPQSATVLRGNWTASSTAVNTTTAVGDASDTTYDKLSSNYSSSSNGASIWFRMAGQAIPTGARVYAASPQIRSSRTGVTARFLKARLCDEAFGGGRAAAALRPIGPDNKTAAAFPVTGTATNYEAPAGDRTVSGAAIDQTVANALWVELWYAFNTDTRIYEVNALLDYDAKPTATITAPTGTITDTSSPIVAWDYQDDLQDQLTYVVRIYSSGGALVYTSDVDSSSASFHEVTTNLPNDTYSIQLQVAQNWAGPGDTFWGDTVTGSFTLAVEKPSTPILTTTVQDTLGSVLINSLHNLNIMNYDIASQENGPDGQFTNNNLLLTKSAVDKHAGTNSMLATINATVGASACLFEAGAQGAAAFTAVGGEVISFSVYAKAKAGSATNLWVPWIQFIDTTGAVVGTTRGAGQNISTAGWTEIKMEATMPANLARVQVRLTNGSVATLNDGYYFDDFYLHFGTSANIPATNRRGGFFPSFENSLSYDDSTLENNQTTWISGNANSVVDISSTLAVHGTLALRVTRTGSTGTAVAILKDTYFPVTPGNNVRASARIRAGTTGRVYRQILKYYDSNLTPLASSVATTTDVTTGWQTIDSGSGANPVPAGAVYGTLSYEFDAVVVGEFHYIDMIFVSFNNPNTVVHPVVAWDPGYITADGPYTTIEYSEDSGTTWYELGTYSLTRNVGSINVTDYEIGSARSRIYRAYNWKTFQGKTVRSDTSSSTSANAQTLSNVWLHATSDPAGTIYNFRYDAAGRTDSPEVAAVLTSFAGRTDAQVDFGEDNKRTLTVSLELPSAADRAALLELARTKSTVVFRDQRGRRVRGAITGATITDETWGQSASVTISMGGGQWPYD